ncbi:hypothetical protein CTAYLR_006311 [Chrysophaeum taylorii]|uniref:Peptidase S26 domain-containing protein n=1 Tax=Chrysophaeum taylorii TaxID=2483200 RepID=A0AAD7U9V2_9STRA|nr:hypothetical protein CTAYLR_006311 [Chrysophaeum taylorii]
MFARRLSSAAAATSSSSLREAAETVWGITKFAAFLHCLHEYVVEISMCCGPSMLPTLNAAGDIVLMDRISHRFDRIKTGDVVICKSPTDATQTVCKRVAAVGGEVVPGSLRRRTVPPGCIWLLGDNPDNSTDSRYYGAVPAGLIKGRVFCRIYPLNQARLF